MSVIEAPITTTTDEAVERGVQLLDERSPGWRDQIDCSVLSMESCEHCILGQLFGDYGDGTEALQIDGTKFGFDSDDEGPKRYERLDRAWRDKVGCAEKGET